MAAPAADEGRRIPLAAVAGAHGIKGEVRLKLFSDSSESLTRHSKLFVGGAPRKLISVRHAGKGAIARFEGIADRPGLKAYGARWSRSTEPTCRRSTKANITTRT